MACDTRHTHSLVFMKATIVSHEAVPARALVLKVHRFKFVLDDRQTLPRTQTSSLRTARVLVSEFPAADAFMKY
jgi:hypothetical protein